MDLARIAELLDPFLGPQGQRPDIQDLIPDISTYIDILQRWNARINLTAIRDEEEIVTRHFGESLFAARHLFPNRVATGASPVQPGRSPADGGRDFANHGEKQIIVHNRGRAAVQGREDTQEGKEALAPAVANDHRPTTNDPARTSHRLTLADIGSGAGFPGIPIKLWAPEITLTLIESNHKKATFLKEVTRALTLTNVNIQTARAETLASASFDVVTLRAVERFESILPVAASLVAPGGRLALLIGQDQLPFAQSTLPNLPWTGRFPHPTSHSRVLAIAVRRQKQEPK